jgi:hypothetical protein
VAQRVFFDLQQGDADLGRIVLGLYGALVVLLVLGDKGRRLCGQGGRCKLASAEKTCVQN